MLSGWATTHVAATALNEAFLVIYFAPQLSTRCQRVCCCSSLLLSLLLLLLLLLLPAAGPVCAV
jgi:hypothetical protein